MVAPTGFSRVSLGFDPARGDQTPTGDTGPWFSVGTNNYAGIFRISSGTVEFGGVALTAVNSSTTTFVANGVTANSMLYVNPTSDVTGGLKYTSWVSEANVGATNLSANTTVNRGAHTVRWYGVAL